MKNLGACMAALRDDVLPNISKARNVLADMRVEIEEAMDKQRRALGELRRKHALENQVWIGVGGGGALLMVIAAVWLSPKPQKARESA